MPSLDPDSPFFRSSHKRILINVNRRQVVIIPCQLPFQLLEGPITS